MESSFRVRTVNRAVRIWTILQSLHFTWAIVSGEIRPVRFGDPLLWYLEQNWLFAGLLGLLLVPQVTNLFRETAPSGREPAGRPPANPATCQRIDELLRATVILDSNIWMNPSLDDFFHRLRIAVRTGPHVLTLFGPQFDEICNIKDRAPYASKRGRLARLALSRIEAMQGAGCLQIDPLVLQAHPRAYADPRILTLIDRLTGDGQTVHFVSDDRELRIRARQIADQKPGSMTVCTSRCLPGIETT